MTPGCNPGVSSHQRPVPPARQRARLLEAESNPPAASGVCGRGDWDIGVSLGWCSDYPDPDTFLNRILGPSPWESGRHSWTLDTQKYARKLAAAKRLVGSAHLAAFGKLDLEVMRDAAPGRRDAHLQQPLPLLESR
jgi:hypothetical protein